MIHYLIAKYVDDLSRNEPMNIGVLVNDGVDMIARFDGENDAGKIDRRRVRNRITGTSAYKAWVTYWRAILDAPALLDRGLRDLSPGDARVVERLLQIPSRDFYLERGGTILLDADDRSIQETLDDLFVRLVRQR